MVMEHSHDSESHSIHDLAHIENPSSHQAKMEIMLLKIAIDAVDAYNHVCKDHKIDIVSIDNAQSNSVYDEVDDAVQMQKKHTSHYNSHSAEENEEIADEEAMAALTEALESEASEAADLSEDDLELEYNHNNEMSAESISNMISGSDSEVMEADSAPEIQSDEMSFKADIETPTMEANNQEEVLLQEASENNSTALQDDTANQDVMNVDGNDEVAVNVAQEESMVDSEQTLVADSNSAPETIKADSTTLDAMNDIATDTPVEQETPSIKDENNAS